MNAIKNWLLVFCTILLANGCAPLRTPVIVRNAPIEMYKYAYISPTKELTSSTGGTYGGQYGIYGSSTTKSVNPSDVIAGILIKQGYIINIESIGDHVSASRLSLCTRTESLSVSPFLCK